MFPTIWQQVAAGSPLNLNSVADHENQVGEGQRARLVLQLRLPLSQSKAGQLQRELDSHKVTEAKVTTSGNDVNIVYRKGMFWVPLILVLVLALAILIVGWRFYKEAPAAFSALMLCGIALAIAATIYLLGNERSGSG